MSEAPVLLPCAISAMAVGVFLSGCRDLHAALEPPGGDGPWLKIPHGS